MLVSGLVLGQEGSHQVGPITEDLKKQKMLTKVDDEVEGFVSLSRGRHFHIHI